MRHLMGLYAVTVLIATFCFKFWGQFAYKGFFANLGRGLIWPAIVFPSVGKVLGALLLIVVIGGVLAFGRRQ